MSQVYDRLIYALAESRLQIAPPPCRLSYRMHKMTKLHERNRTSSPLVSCLQRHESNYLIDGKAFQFSRTTTGNKGKKMNNNTLKL